MKIHGHGIMEHKGMTCTSLPGAMALQLIFIIHIQKAQNFNLGLLPTIHTDILLYHEVSQTVS
jgi:hypothetical protein